jgi:RNA polymerase sigma factor (sigma-70 family)
LLRNNQNKLERFDSIEIVLRLQNSEVSAFNTVYWKYHAAIYANVFKLLKDEAIAEDIVQEVFIALWEKRHSLTVGKPIAGWLFVVSYNKSIIELKKNLRKTTEEKSAQKLFSDVAETEVEINIAQWAVFEKAIEQLSPQKRKVFDLCKMQGKTYEQAALELGISKHTVKEYLSDAMAFIKKYVQQHDEHFAFLLITAMIANFLF